MHAERDVRDEFALLKLNYPSSLSPLRREVQRPVAGELDDGGGEGAEEVRADGDPQVEDGGLRRRRLGRRQQRAVEFQRGAPLLRHCHLHYR